jgi:Peptidase family M28
VSVTPPTSIRSADELVLRQVVDALAPIERAAGSPGEREAAEWLAERLRRAGCEVQIDEERYLPGYAREIGRLAAAGAAGGLLGLGRRTRRLGMAAAALSTALIADDISNGPRLFRRATTSPTPTWNVVASCGDPNAARTLVVMGHHDAAPSGAIFDDRAQRWIGERFPGLIERIDTSLPLWWLVISGPALIARGAARRHTATTALGTGIAAVSTAAFADIAGSPTVPGANDNLSAVAVLVGFAELLRTDPIPGLRVLLVSCGAEEVIQGGIYSFVRGRLSGYDRAETFVLNLDTVGSPELALVEGEGATLMEDYFFRPFRDLVARAADNAGASLRRGMRARNSTDAVVTSRAGYPTATLISMDRYKALSNYHQISDTAENIEHRTLAHALTVVEATARELADHPWF